MAERTFLEQLDDRNDEAWVRERLAAGNYNSRHASLAQEWLRSKEAARSDLSSTKRDAREEETLAIAREALSIAKDANRIASDDLSIARNSATSARTNARWAMWAAIIAIIAAVIATKDQILALIFGNP